MGERWIVPVAGRYHVVSGREPHLVKDCPPECPMQETEAGTVVRLEGGDVGGIVHFQNSGSMVTMSGDGFLFTRR